MIDDGFFWQGVGVTNLCNASERQLKSEHITIMTIKLKKIDIKKIT